MLFKIAVLVFLQRDYRRPAQGRQRGIELVAQQQNVLVRGLELTGSVTYVDAEITGNSSYVATALGATSIGKRTPYVPAWCATAVATSRPDDHWAYTLAGRYSGRLYATVENTDINPATYQGFEGYFVADARGCNIDSTGSGAERLASTILTIATISRFILFRRAPCMRNSSTTFEACGAGSETHCLAPASSTRIKGRCRPRLCKNRRNRVR